MKNIQVIPTDKPSRLLRAKSNGNIFLNHSKDFIFDTEYWEYLNIYITNDEEIKEGDWYFITESISKCESKYEANDLTDICKKIILTTDQDLINDGVQAIDDEFLEWFVKNPSCEFVEWSSEKIEGSFDGEDWKFNYGIVIPKEEPKQELLPDFKITKNIFDFVNDLSDTKKEESTLESAKPDWDSLIGAVLDEPLTSWDEPKKERKPWGFCETPEEKCTMNYCDENGCQNRKRVLVEPKQETLEEVAANLADPNLCKTDNWIAGAKYQAERMYSQEDMLEFTKYLLSKKITKAKSISDLEEYLPKEFQLLSGELMRNGKELISEWFEQFKKK